MSPRSSSDIDRIQNGEKSSMNKLILPNAPIKKVSFSTCETIPTDTDTEHTERNIITIKEELDYFYDCDEDDEDDEDHNCDDHDENGDENVTTTSSTGVVEATTKATVSTKKVRRRKIRWSGQVRVQEIRHVNNMSELEIDAVWMTAIEYKMIKHMAKTTVYMMMAGEVIDEDDPDFCTRGLEFRTRKGSKVRGANKLRARSAVLNEQDLQREEGFHDPEFIAMSSLDVSFENREQAQKRAQKDAKSVLPHEVDVVLF